MPTDEIGKTSGIRSDDRLGGIQVELWDNYHSKFVARTTTNQDGKYGFQKLNPLLKYRAVFTYDGMRFENTDYVDDLSGGYSVAREKIYMGKDGTPPIGSDRYHYNDLFGEISSSPQNYEKDGEWRKAYGLYTKLEDANENYIDDSGNSGPNSGAYRYYDALEKFKELAMNADVFNSGMENDMKGTYYKVGTGIDNGYYTAINFKYDDIKNDFISALIENKVSEREANSVWQYIKDTMITALTEPYPPVGFNKFILEDVDGLTRNTCLGYESLYTEDRDQSRNVDLGLKLRLNADLNLSKDVYKATLLVNGKKQEYFYNRKDIEKDTEGHWVINQDTGMYEYRSQDGPTSDSAERAKNKNYIGEKAEGEGDIYTRDIRKSEYLYDGSDVRNTEDDDIRNLQVFITYKIAIKNQGHGVYTSVDEIVDYYDASQYYSSIDLVNEHLPESTIINENTYLGNSEGGKVGDLIVSDESIYKDDYGSMEAYYDNSKNYNINGFKMEDEDEYKTLFLTGIKSINGDSNLLEPGEMTYAYITFKVQNDPKTGKVKLDQKIEDLLNNSADNVLDLIGKRNIAEINGYSTYLESGGKAGAVDVDSNAGSLKPKDLNPQGDIISSSVPENNRLEDDEDKASNIKLRINQVKEDERSIEGYTFEDARTDVSDKAVIGNGRYNEENVDFENNKDKKINGITVQLVELIQSVDDEGFAKGDYEEEHIWTSTNYEYKADENKWTTRPDATPRYYSGTDKSKVILSGPNALSVTPSDLTAGDGLYKFDSLPPGDFFIRFIYGDTTQTVLTNMNRPEKDYIDDAGNKDEVQAFFNGLDDGEEGDAREKEIRRKFVEEETDMSGKSTKIGIEESNIPEYDRILDTKGLNSKSYTGQDYKSTIYQVGIDQNTIKYEKKNESPDEPTEEQVDIDGYVRIDDEDDQVGQNYDRDHANNKKAMYYYDIAVADPDRVGDDGTDNKGISDAKDVYSYRADEEAYSSGSGSTYTTEQSLKNHRAEVLASGTKLVAKAEEMRDIAPLEETPEKVAEDLTQAMNLQKTAIRELVENTSMISQSGVINAEVEYNRKQTNVYNNESKAKEENLLYTIRDLDLGLTERPEAQLLVENELTNIQILLSDKSILFDTNQSVHNLMFAKHKEYAEKEYYNEDIGTSSNKGFRLKHDIQNTVRSRPAELTIVTMDEELMRQADIRLTYKISVDNIGEVDYLDKQFYYTGKTKNASLDNVSRTNLLNVLDYVTNEVNYDPAEGRGNWTVETSPTLLGDESSSEKEDDDYVNSTYADELSTYSTLLRTDKLSGDLIPRKLDEESDNYENSRRDVDLILRTHLTDAIEDKNVIYTNFIEIIETKNSLGRRLELSKVGDEAPPYQSEEKSIDESTIWLKPKQIDADSAQKVQIVPPTGEDRDYQRFAIMIIGSLIIIVIIVVIIKNNI